MEAAHDAGHVATIDLNGNVICTTNYSGVLFSCHTDTMHKDEGENDIEVDDFGIVTAWRKPKVQSGMDAKRERDILGADDGAGIYIMLRMIEEGIPGTYVFHADEEIGCKGSRALAEAPWSIGGFDLEDDFTHAIAFDRRGTSDLITWQLGMEMCSRACSVELMNRLNTESSLNYKPAEGIVTDTAMYEDQVQECINLSVGYYDEHTTDERLDLGHLYALLARILENPELFVGLPVARDLDEEDITPDNYTFVPDSPAIEDDTVASLVLKHPREVAEVLEGFFGVDYDELFNLLNARG